MFFFPLMKQTFNIDLLSFKMQPLLLFLAKMFCKNSVMSQREHIFYSLFGLYLVYIFFFSFQQSFLTKLKGSRIFFKGRLINSMLNELEIRSAQVGKINTDYGALAKFC